MVVVRIEWLVFAELRIGDGPCSVWLMKVNTVVVLKHVEVWKDNSQ